MFLLAALYFCTSALIGHDRGRLTTIERLARLGVTIMLLTPTLALEIGGLLVGLALVGYRYVVAPRTVGRAA